MENDDLFVDDDETTEEEVQKPAPKAKGSKQPVKKAKKPEPVKTAGKKNPPAQKPLASATVNVGTAEDSSISLMLASILVIVAFVVGFAAGGLLLGSNSSAQPEGTQAVGVPQGTSVPGGVPGGTNTDAGPLTQDQVQKGLPKGHPQLPSGTATGTAAPKPKSSK